MTEVGKIEFNTNPKSAEVVTPIATGQSGPPAGWPQSKTKEELVKSVEFVHDYRTERMNEELMEKMEEEKLGVLSKQVGGSHYKQYKIQPYEFFIVNQIPHHKAAIIRRILRYDHPTGKGLEDLQKIMHELEMIIQLENWENIKEFEIDTQVEEEAC